MLEMDQQLANPNITEVSQANSPTNRKRLQLSRSTPYGPRYRSLLQKYSVKDIIGRLQAVSEVPIDATEVGLANAQPQPADMLAAFPVKHLRFAEDVRPPYHGTFSRIPPQRSALRMGRNPFERSLPETDYDYDSEAEWDEPEDGEELDSEGEEELGSDEDGDDMAGFLDDEDAADAPGATNKKRLAASEMEPISSGLCWEGSDGRVGDSNPCPPAEIDLRQYKLEMILGMSIYRVSGHEQMS
jgi:chromatin assembly factor 1 subunit A